MEQVAKQFLTIQGIDPTSVNASTLINLFDSKFKILSNEQRISEFQDFLHLTKRHDRILREHVAKLKVKEIKDTEITIENELKALRLKKSQFKSHDKKVSPDASIASIPDPCIYNMRFKITHVEIARALSKKLNPLPREILQFLGLFCYFCHHSLLHHDSTISKPEKSALLYSLLELKPHLNKLTRQNIGEYLCLISPERFTLSQVLTCYDCLFGIYEDNQNANSPYVNHLLNKKSTNDLTNWWFNDN
jgi:hypothetical protein